MLALQIGINVISLSHLAVEWYPKASADPDTNLRRSNAQIKPPFSLNQAAVDHKLISDTKLSHRRDLVAAVPNIRLVSNNEIMSLKS